MVSVAMQLRPSESSPPPIKSFRSLRRNLYRHPRLLLHGKGPSVSLRGDPAFERVKVILKFFYCIIQVQLCTDRKKKTLRYVSQTVFYQSEIITPQSKISRLYQFFITDPCGSHITQSFLFVFFIFGKRSFEPVDL